MIIVGKDNWRKEYRKGNHKAVWIVVNTDIDTLYLQNFEDWIELKKRSEQNSLTIKTFGLQYKTHLVEHDAENADGIYLIKSVKGMIGGDSIDTYTTGVINKDKVKKVMWSIPSLVKESEFEDNIENCFEEAIIHNEKRKKTGTV